MLTPVEQQATSPPQPQSLEQHVIVPLLQNVAGGIAAGTLTYIGFAVTGQFTDQLFWSLVTGITTTSLATIVRFFGDDLGIVTTAYRAGAASRTEEINRLTSELSALRTALNGQQRTATSTTKTSKLDMLKRSYDHAKIMAENGIRGRPIDRRTCGSQYQIGEVDFGRAYRLLQESGIRNQQDTFTVTQVSEAKQKLHAYFNYHYQIAASNPKYNPPWL